MCLPTCVPDQKIPMSSNTHTRTHTHTYTYTSEPPLLTTSVRRHLSCFVVLLRFLGSSLSIARAPLLSPSNHPVHSSRSLHTRCLFRHWHRQLSYPSSSSSMSRWSRDNHNKLFFFLMCHAPSSFSRVRLCLLRSFYSSLLRVWSRKTDIYLDMRT